MQAFNSLLKKNFILSISFLFAAGIYAQTTNITGPAGSGKFGTSVTVLANGNYVVTDPNWDDGAIAEVGAVYLYNGATHALISRVTGSTTMDRVGGGGITQLTNGNFVIKSSNWNNGLAGDAGAVTWVNGTTGLNGTVSSANSLVGSTDIDQVGITGIIALSNGNYVVSSILWNNGAAGSAGAATWCNGATGRTGVVSPANSLVGSSTGDNVGSIITLTNGNYLVRSTSWDNGAATNAGAVTWASGTTGITGAVSAANSLIGSTASDQAGSVVTPLTNGNYVAGSSGWDNGATTNAGAATWCDGTTGRTGSISSANSLIGSSLSQVGVRITALTNGNYVVGSPLWNLSTGAATWGNGTTGITGLVSSANSLTGGGTNQNIGTTTIALTNGNYVTYSTTWDNGGNTDVGAVTWGSGTTGVTGTVSSSNSLIGSTTNDQVGSSVIALSNGNYVVNSSQWDNGAAINAGASTWGDGTAGRTGTISAANSIIGSAISESVGATTTGLTNGNYVVAASGWDNGAVADVGAVRLCDGTTGATGNLTGSNSLTGTTANDRVGTGIRALSNGNYVVVSQNWINGAIPTAGAATWCSGTVATTGPLTTTNSLTGSASGDFNSATVVALTNGNYVVQSPNWDNGAITNVGAVTLGNGSTGTTGAVTVANSLIGSTSADNVGINNATTTPDGNYMLRSFNWDNGVITEAGAVSFGDGTVAVTGIVSSCNSVLGTVASGGSNHAFIYDTMYNRMIVGKPAENMVSIFDPAIPNSLVSTDICNTATVAVTGTTYRNSCKLIAKVLPSGGSPVTGSINSCVTLDATQQFFNSEPYVQRHYDIEPATANTSTTSATITLYFTDAEFSTFNTNNAAWPKLPTVAGGGNSDSRRANLKVTQYHGTPTILPSEPRMYTGGPGVYINPNDNDIVWNGYYWAVTFDVVGFSGFYVHSNPVAPLPVALNYFRGTKRGSDHLLDWKLNCDGTVGANIILERSDNTTGPFTSINAITTDATRCNQSFNYTDAQPINGMNYYRLKITDNNGKVTYSNIVALLNADKGFEITGIVPNPVPANGLFKLNISSTHASVIQLNITDVHGRVLIKEQRKVIAGFNGIDMNAVRLASGTYYISVMTDDGRKKVVRFVKR